ncbi:sporulation protein [Paenibacillus sp.]|uniref:sporulation protein n=1 Tax=Paenibacillus sp. TaxID=58172 RepID=UPI002D2A5577|nr:sporulation protein [Paenibacillus sp.]HZG84998.1 sporulation protein [Paenibacillus sp.]
MSFFNRVMASIGIGAAQVDTVLEKNRYAPGELVRGVVKIKGGNVEQQVDSIYISVMTQYVKEVDDRKVYQSAEVAKTRVSEPFLVKPQAASEIPFSFELPLTTPLSVGRTPVWLKTGLDIKSAVDPTDDDKIEVVPNAAMQAVLDGVSELGFRLRNADCEYAPRFGYGAFVQELEFVPMSGPYRGRLDELEVIMHPRGDSIDLFLQVDRRARGLAGLFSEALEMDETNVRFTLDAATLSRGAGAVAAQLDAVIRRYS